MTTRRIYRYDLDLVDEPTVRMPLGAEVLSASTVRGRLEVWALVDTAETVTRTARFRVIGTGNPMPDDPGRFVSTVMTHGGALVFHVFEATR